MRWTAYTNLAAGKLPHTYFYHNHSVHFALYCLFLYSGAFDIHETALQPGSALVAATCSSPLAQGTREAAPH
jgi:hypothetical protein